MGMPKLVEGPNDSVARDTRARSRGLEEREGPRRLPTKASRGGQMVARVSPLTEPQTV